MKKFRVTITRNWKGFPLKFRRVAIGNTETKVIAGVISEFGQVYNLGSIINVSYEVVK